MTIKSMTVSICLGGQVRLSQVSSTRVCVFPMVIWPAFRMGQYRVIDHPYHAPQFNGSIQKFHLKNHLSK